MEKKWKRRNFFIKKELQGRYIFSFFILVILGSILYTAIFSFLSANTLTIVYKGNNLILGQTPYILFTQMLKANWILMLSGGVIVVVISVFLTHRFAGPIYRFERTIDEMARGNLDFNITLRRHDEGKELADAINRLKNTLSSNVESMRELSYSIETHLNKASAALPEGNTEAQAALSRTKENNKHLRQILDSYTLKK